MPHRIALIHAVQVAVAPVPAAFARLWPEARCANVLDDSLSADLERDGALTPAMIGRFHTLADYAVASGADGILFTCSAFGPAIEDVAAKAPVPVLKPNEAMFEEALRRGQRIGMLASFAPSIPSMTEEFQAMAAAARSTATLETACVPEAMRALREGDGATHDRLLASAAHQLEHCDVVLLAQFSTARAEAAVAAAIGRPVMTSPASAVAKLKSLLA
jgi:Asp/Glu/hydantoin racemase